MSVSTWAPARHITDDAVHISEVALASGGRLAVVGRRGRGGVTPRQRFSGVGRPALRLVPPLPAVAEWLTGADWPTGATPTPDPDTVSDPEDEPTGSTGPMLDSGVAGASAQTVLSDSFLARRSNQTRPPDRSAAGPIPIIRSASSPGRARSARAPVRLTPRGRLVLAGLLLLFAAAMVGTLASTVEAAAPPGPPRAVVVHPGDTLWSIAARVHPRGSLTDTMLTIERLNHMPDGIVYVGQQLLLPNS